MSYLRYILRSVWFFRRQHMAVFLGTLISTAVLTGALIVGDSVKFSLNRLVEMRLGKTQYALQTGDRFVYEHVAEDIALRKGADVTSLLSVKGVVISPQNDLRINNVQVLGTDSSFLNFFPEGMPLLEKNEVIISANISRKMNLKTGDEFLLRVENSNLVPLNAPFVSDKRPDISLRVKVKAIADEHNMGRFSLKSNQTAPFNVFISRNSLADKLKLSGLVNLILVAAVDENPLSEDDLNDFLKQVWQLRDAGLNIRELPKSGGYEIVSDRIFIDDPIVKVVQNTALSHERILTYMVNTIRTKERETPYSFVTAATPSYLSKDIKNNEVIVNQWLAEDLAIYPGDTISMDYYVVGPLRTLLEKSSSFVVKDVVPDRGGIADPTLMPDFPGLSDAGNCRDWKAGIPLDFKRIRDKDETYWDDYKGTPKAWVSIETGVELWSNQYGKYTSLRFPGIDVKPADLREKVLRGLTPKSFNFIFVPVLRQGSEAVNNMVDFSSLFLSLSFFIIAAGILLTVLIYALNTESRHQEIGILTGLGFSRGNIIKLRFLESIVISVLGGVVGATLGILYNKGVISGLNSVWQDIVRTDMLEIHIKPFTLIAGASIGVVLALAAILIVIWRKLSYSVTGILQNRSSVESKNGIRWKLFSKIVAIVSLLGVVIIVNWSFYKTLDKSAELLLMAGGLFLMGMVALIYIYLLKVDSKDGNLVPTIISMALKNAARNKARSLTIVLLLGLGVFSIIITGANRKTYLGSDFSRSSGTGGYGLLAETTMPILNNLNTREGKRKLGLEDEKILDDVEFVQIYSREGDDASCLNLNKVQQPQILGVPNGVFDRVGAFSFAKLLKDVDSKHPWMALNVNYKDGVVPAIADQSVITWGLKKSVGDTLIYKNEHGEEIKLLLVGGLSNSIFQGKILIADTHFRKLYPSTGGTRIVMMDLPGEKQLEVAEMIEMYLRDYGITVDRSSNRLAEFYSVENTYLTVFMLLGGLGVIIGTIGLGIVLLRNMLARRKEIGLLIALGFNRATLLKLVITENILLLLAGLGCGIGAAIVGILPSLLSQEFDVSGFNLFVLVASIFISGVFWIWFPAQYSMKRESIVTLRDE